LCSEAHPPFSENLVAQPQVELHVGKGEVVLLAAVVHAVFFFPIGGCRLLLLVGAVFFGGQVDGGTDGGVTQPGNQGVITCLGVVFNGGSDVGRVFQVDGWVGGHIVHGFRHCFGNGLALLFPWCGNGGGL